MTCKLCNDTGEQRYWEGRWRDEKAENDKLRELIARLIDNVETGSYESTGQCIDECRRHISEQLTP